MLFGLLQGASHRQVLQRLPRRWLGERSFGWVARFRRLAVNGC
jgi:transposase